MKIEDLFSNSSENPIYGFVADNNSLPDELDSHLVVFGSINNERCAIMKPCRGKILFKIFNNEEDENAFKEKLAHY